MLFRGEFSTPTEAQYAMLGRAVVDWSILDLLIETLLARLLRAPDFPSSAITRRLGFEARLQALDALMELHRVRYGHRLLPQEALAAVKDAIARARTLKPFRNQVAHWIWFRSDDETLFATPLLARQPKAKKTDGMTVTNAALRRNIADVEALAEMLQIAFDRMPEVDEMAGRTLPT